jgi:hypothetical protein
MGEKEKAKISREREEKLTLATKIFYHLSL